jgi:hypothetical protein
MPKTTATLFRAVPSPLSESCFPKFLLPSQNQMIHSTTLRKFDPGHFFMSHIATDPGPPIQRPPSPMIDQISQSEFHSLSHVHNTRICSVFPHLPPISSIVILLVRGMKHVFLGWFPQLGYHFDIVALIPDFPLLLFAPRP